jgi:predicted membrane channel-forming protein YqfA (hemolysin III family)
LFLCVSEALHHKLYLMDVVGIVVLIYGSAIAGLYNAFYCRPWLLATYLGIFTGLICTTGALTGVARFHAPRYKPYRVASLFATGAFGLVPSIHWLISARAVETDTFIATLSLVCGRAAPAASGVCAG